MNPWYTPRPNTDLPGYVDPHVWAAAIANRSDATLIASLTDDLLEALHARKQMQAELDHARAAHRTAEWIEELTENQAVIRAWKERCADAERERDRLIRWQAEAVEVLKRWDRFAELVPGSFKVLGARMSDCTHAYIDHLREENRTLAKELLTMATPLPTITFSDGESEWVNP